MIKKENQAGLSFTNLKLRIVELINSDDNFTVENVDEAYFSEPVNFEKDKETKLYSILQNAFDELIIKKPISSSSVSVALPFELFSVMHIPYDNSLLNEDLIEQFRWEFSVNFPHINSRDLVIQYFEMEKNQFLDYNSAIVLGIPRKYLHFISGFCDKNELQLKFVDNSHFAAERALALNSRSGLKGLILSIYVAAKYVSIVFLYEGKPVHCRLLPINNAAEIIPLIKDELKNNEFMKGGKGSLNEAYINGDDVSDIVVNSLTEKLGISFIKFNPFDKLPYNQELSKNRNFTENYNSFSSAAGIAFRLA
jgi:Tfp pilus assembly protein, ATPase PilM